MVFRVLLTITLSLASTAAAAPRGDATRPTPRPSPAVGALVADVANDGGGPVTLSVGPTGPTRGGGGAHGQMRPSRQAAERRDTYRESNKSILQEINLIKRTERRLGFRV